MGNNYNLKVFMNQLKIQDNLAISDSGFLFFPTTGETFTLNELGKQIIQGLHDGKDSEKIIEQIMEKFDADRETVERDLDDFLSQLKNYDLVKEV